MKKNILLLIVFTLLLSGCQKNPTIIEANGIIKAESSYAINPSSSPNPNNPSHITQEIHGDHAKVVINVPTKMDIENVYHGELRFRIPDEKQTKKLFFGERAKEAIYDPTKGYFYLETDIETPEYYMDAYLGLNFGIEYMNVKLFYDYIDAEITNDISEIDGFTKNDAQEQIEKVINSLGSSPGKVEYMNTYVDYKKNKSFYEFVWIPVIDGIPATNNPQSLQNELPLYGTIRICDKGLLYIQGLFNYEKNNTVTIENIILPQTVVSTVQSVFDKRLFLEEDTLYDSLTLEYNAVLEEGKCMFSPIWHLSSKDGKSIYVDAVTGEYLSY